MSQTYWKIKAADLTERETDYTATFICTNADTGRTVNLTLQQNKNEPASDLIGSCLAVAQLLQRTAAGEELETETTTQVARLH